jgi:hypothetical protein
MVALIVACVALAGCDALEDAMDIVEGSGNVITETRDVSDFDDIALLGSGDVDINVTGVESVVIEAEDNIMPLLTADVRNGRLELGSESRFSTDVGVKYTITVASLNGVEISGSGDVTAAGVDAGSFEVRIIGSGDVRLVGAATQLGVEISGSGNYAGEELLASVGDVQISGSGTAVVNVADELDASVSGSGSIEYLGDPAVNASTSGSGDISRR